MSNGYRRTRARKTIKLPGGDSVDIPVIVTLAVADQNGQETQLTALNTSENQTRQVHIDEVRSSHGTAGSIFVERIDSWVGNDQIERAQDSNFSIDNKTGGDATPPHFSTHQKTHVYRYYQNPGSPDDSGAWVDSELIDEISVIDQNGQEWVYFILNNPQPGDLTGQADSGDPNITDNALDPPYRTDPWQNIVDFHGHTSTGGGAVPPFCVTATFTASIVLNLYGAGNNGPQATSNPPINAPGWFFAPVPGDAGTIKGAIGTLVGNQAEIDNINSSSQQFHGTVSSHFFGGAVSWGVTLASGGSGVTSWTVAVSSWSVVATNGHTYSFSSCVPSGPEQSGFQSVSQSFTLTFCR